MKFIPFFLIACIVTLSSISKAEIMCYRKVQDGRLPFIKYSDATLSLSVKKEGASFKGVQFNHSKESPSPHVTITHIESAFYVFGGKKKGDDERLEATLERHPYLLEPLKALCIEVKPTLSDVKQVEELWLLGKESYKVTTALHPNPHEYIVTKESIVQALKNQKISSTVNVQAILIKIHGGESYSKDWPYLTNEAMNFIMTQFDPSVVAINTPSLDREKDEGVTSNHKIVFKDLDRLVLELGDFSQLNSGLYRIKLNPKLEKSIHLEDCAPSLLVAQKIESFN